MKLNRFFQCFKLEDASSALLRNDDLPKKRNLLYVYTSLVFHALANSFSRKTLWKLLPANIPCQMIERSENRTSKYQSIRDAEVS